MKDLSHTNFHFHRFRYQQASPVAFVQIADHPFESSMVLMEPHEECQPFSFDRKGGKGNPAMHIPEDEAIGR